MTSTKTALLLGATGLIGKECLNQLLADPRYQRVVSIARRPSDIQHPKLEQIIIDFEKLDEMSHAFKGDDLFYCIGTTINQVNSREDFKKIDFGYALKVAQIAHRQGVSQFLIITSIGASPSSPSFYLRVKGELEEAISKLGFKALHIFRPSFLFGDRLQHRPLEELSIPVFRALTPLMLGPLKKYRPVHATQVAKKMIEAAQSQKMGITIYFPSMEN